MGVFNIRRRRFELLSEPQNGDLMAISLMKVSSIILLHLGKKAVCRYEPVSYTISEMDDSKVFMRANLA